MSKVSIVRCADYDTTRVAESVKAAVDQAGGMNNFVKPGMKVLLKPNLLSPRAPEEAVCTHPEVVRAVARLVIRSGGKPVIGDSPGGYGNNIEDVFDKSGMRAMAMEEGVELVKFTISRFVDGIPFTRYLFDCDCHISIPKLKTHSLMVLTAAVKNTYGTVTGLFKAECHSKAPKEEDFAKVISKVYSIARPRLSVLDGILAMEGDGPAAGTPKRMNFVMAGDDAVSIDACVSAIIGVSPSDILTTRQCHGMGLGEADLAKIQILGDDITGFIDAGFRLPRTTPLKMIPRSIAGGLSSLIRFKPYIITDKCARCNLCKVTCPVSAIEIKKERCRIDYSKCVRCLCCHEVCPYKAIKIKRNFLTKMVWG